MKPAGFCILVKPDAPKEQLKNNLIEIPTTVLERQRLEVNTGILLDIGSQAWKGLGNSQPWANIGDHVIYAKHGGKLIKDPDTEEEFVLLNDKDIIGFVN